MLEGAWTWLGLTPYPNPTPNLDEGLVWRACLGLGLG